MEKTFLLDQLLPADAATLGRLVLSTRYPDQDFYDPGEPPADVAISEQRADKFTYSASASRTSGLHAFLTSLLSGALSGQDSTSVDLSAAVCVTRQLRNSAGFFRRLFAADPDDVGMRIWLEQAVLTRRTVYLVTGIKTVTDAEVKMETVTDSAVQADVRAPVTLAAAASVGLPFLGADGALDVGAGGSKSRRAEERTGFAVAGEQIFAVQYRKIRFAMFKETTPESARLGDGVQWKMYLGTRNFAGEDQGDMVEAKIAEAGDEGEGEGEGDEEEEEGLERFESGGDVFFYPAKTTGAGDGQHVA